VLVDDDIQLPETKAKIMRFPYRQVSKDVGKLTTGTVALASLLRHSGLFPIEALKESISTFQKPAIAETNLKAIEAGVLIIAY
jgi:Pyruvate/2-oxoacid:ferredoxin oxidoreductase gamma subunit